MSDRHRPDCLAKSALILTRLSEQRVKSGSLDALADLDKTLPINIRIDGFGYRMPPSTPYIHIFPAF